MPFKLQPNEIAFYPQPFVESEPNLLVITNQRVAHFGDDGHQEIAARQLEHMGRVSERPLLLPGLLAAVLGLPLLVVGLYLFLSVRGMASPAAPAAAPAAAAPANPAGIADDPSGAPPGEGDSPAPAADPSSPTDPATTRIAGIALGAFGLLLLAGAFLAVRRQRHYVILRGGPRVMRIRATDKIQQNQILMTVQATQSGARAGSGAPAPKAAVQVDDKGDPVKALQELSAARQAGKIKDDEFQAKREVLLERVKNRK